VLSRGPFRPYSPQFLTKNRYKTVTPILGILTLSAACNASQAILESAHSVVIVFLDTTINKSIRISYCYEPVGVSARLAVDSAARPWSRRKMLGMALRSSNS
jgi:hypothetical protein